jgi:hypothetical protein
MKRIILLLSVIFACLSASAYDLPEGSKLLYHGEQRYESYGMYWHNFYVYELDGKTYLVRLQNFSGMLEIVTDAEGIARNARKVKMELSKKQVEKLRKAIKKADFIGKTQAYNAEREEFEKALEEERIQEKKKNMVITERGDTIYRLTMKQERHHFHQPTLFSVKVEWPGVLTGADSYGRFYQDDDVPETWKKEGRPARSSLINAISEVDNLLNEWAYNYKLKNYDRDEMFKYSYVVSGGMLARQKADGSFMRQGRKICLEEKNGKWFVTGYVEETEDTVEVNEEVAAKVEEMCNKLNHKATNPTLDEGEKLLKIKATDDEYWRLYVGFLTKDNIDIGEGMLTFIQEPAHAAKAYQKLIADIDAINKYLWSFLKISPNRRK